MVVGCTALSRTLQSSLPVFVPAVCVQAGSTSHEALGLPRCRCTESNLVAAIVAVRFGDQDG